MKKQKVERRKPIAMENRKFKQGTDREISE